MAEYIGVGGGRRVVVTGGNRGIGAAIADRLLKEGYRVVSLARHAADPRPGLESVTADLADPAATAAAAEAIMAAGPVYGIVHNAGVIRPAPVEEAAPRDLEDLTRLHLVAALLLVKAALAGMKEAGEGRVVLMSSRGALGLAGRTAYAATKGGMIAMGRSWALELAPFGITVNTVAPGPIETDMFHEIVTTPEAAARLVRQIPRGRIGSPADVAAAVAFFLAPENDFITGQTLYVCGGTSIGQLQL
ncbi:MAG: oxidoreductase [Rhodothalassiaceae bacterium]|nr:MAG: oxidoreductase [Rhodothalassiaceae bacterium]